MLSYELVWSGDWSGRTWYTFTVNGVMCFHRNDFHSEEHAKRDAAHQLKSHGVDVSAEDIPCNFSGAL